MLGKLTYTAMADAIFAHPLLAEGLNSLFAMFDALSGCHRSSSEHQADVLRARLARPPPDPRQPKAVLRICSAASIDL